MGGRSTSYGTEILAERIVSVIICAPGDLHVSFKQAVGCGDGKSREAGYEKELQRKTMGN
ncbi:hypothetical protein HMPREF0240_02385 [Clostridium sp. D5]|nr:hypothetical protein HMPREF0240_02385 [Clostridium sp. D5]